MSLLLKNCRLATVDPAWTGEADLRIAEGEIAARGRDLVMKEGDEQIDCSGRLIIPGNVCAHTHLYSSLALGMKPPTRRPKSFLDILRRIWWKLDRALDEEAVYYSALVGAIEAAKCGTTLLADHHASPNTIAGSLDLIEHAIREVGLRGILCYEVTDRGGIKERDAGLRENERFVSRHAADPMLRGLIGAHASFTLSTSSLEACGSLAGAYGTGVHIHVAEGRYDVQDARKRYRSGLLNRLDRAGIVRRESLFAHCVHLRRHEYRAVREAGAWLVHNPRSNMNNGVGHAPLHEFGARSALGTDGFTADMFEEARIGSVRSKEVGEGWPGGGVGRCLAGGWQMASEIFGQSFGSLAPGSAADLSVLEYSPPTPFNETTVMGHHVFGLRSAMVRSVMVNGKWIVWNGQVLSVDEEASMRRARDVAQRLWTSIG